MCRANQGRTLKEIYTLFKSDKIQSILSSEDIDIMQPNEVSLRISTEASITLLKDISPEAYNFFYFMGLLPAGLNGE